MAKPDKILAHELLGREVLNLQAGEVAGSVVDFGINREGSVQLIGVLPTAWYLGGRGIAPAAITFLTGDRMCIANGEALQEFHPDGDSLISTDSGGQIYGKTVLLFDGEMLGELVDFRFNLSDGRITDLLVLDSEQRRSRVPIEKITTIGKDYIIIERAAGQESEGSTEAEASPFSQAAAVASAPAAAQLSSEVEVIERPAGQASTRAGRSRGRNRQEPVVDEKEASEPYVPAAGHSESVASVAVEQQSAAEQLRMAETPEAVVPAASNLDEVFVVSSASEQSEPFLLSAADDAQTMSSAAQASETGLASSPGVNISKFDQKKMEFLIGKSAHRDIKDPEGVILVAEGEDFDQSALLRILEAGVLGEVFIEMTLRK
jgi:sporulation protein YlmC with PRC-barrel domain